MTFYRAIPAAILISTTFALGCKGPLPRIALGGSKEPPSADPANDIKLASISEEQPVTYLDSEKLRFGCGQMDPDPSTEFKVTDSGLRYRVLRKSEGRRATASNTVTVSYRGWLDDGKEFDSSYDRGQPISFPLGGVIAGWTEGMQLVGEGGMIELWVPARLGYGKDGSGGSVPPNATLHFIVELIEVQ